MLREKDANVVAVLASVNDGKITFLCACGKEAVKQVRPCGDPFYFKMLGRNEFALRKSFASLELSARGYAGLGQAVVGGP